MRIDAYNKMDKIYNNSKANQITKAKKAGQKVDSIEISDKGRVFQVAKNALKSVADVRQDKVDDIKNRIDSGTYNIDADQLANHIVDKFYDVIG